MIERETRETVEVVRLAHGKVSALDTELLDALDAVLREVEEDARCRACVLTGTGSVFSAGVDLFRVLQDGPEYLAEFVPRMRAAVRHLFALRKPIVAAVNGHAIAGGCVIVCACDYRVMATGDGRIGVPELSVGVPFPAVALEVMRFATPRAHLQHLLLTGRTVRAEEARSRGLVDDVCGPAALLDTAVAFAMRLGAIPPQAFDITKRQLRTSSLRNMDALEAELGDEVAKAWSAPEARAAIQAYLEATVGKSRQTTEGKKSEETR